MGLVLLCYALLMCSSIFGILILAYIRRTRQLELQLKEAIRQLHIVRISRK